MNDEEFLAENLKKDWMVWSNGSSRSTRVFSLCSFPFVYEPAAKSTILSLSNFNTQMGEFHDALRESISWGGGAVPFLVLRVRCWSYGIKVYLRNRVLARFVFSCSSQPVR